jgi:site-specific recombinase XerD
MLDDSGGDLRLVSQTLGHASLGQTIDRYGGIAARAMQKSADAMDRLLEEPAKAKEDVG